MKTGPGMIACVSIAALALSACTTVPQKTDAYWCGEALVAVAPGAAAPSPSCARVLDWVDAPVCGGSLARDEVRLLDLEQADQARAFDSEYAGRYRPAVDAWVAYGASSSAVDTSRRVHRAAAQRGCSLVLLGPVVTLDYLSGGVEMSPRVKRYRLIRMGAVEEGF